MFETTNQLTLIFPGLPSAFFRGFLVSKIPNSISTLIASKPLMLALDGWGITILPFIKIVICYLIGG
jgi:hypothetical protein